MFGLAVKMLVWITGAWVWHPVLASDSSFMQTLGSSSYDSSNWVAATHVGNLVWVPGSPYWPRPISGPEDTGAVKKLMKPLCISVFVSVFFFLLQIEKKLVKYSISHEIINRVYFIHILKAQCYVYISSSIHIGRMLKI